MKGKKGKQVYIKRGEKKKPIVVSVTLQLLGSFKQTPSQLARYVAISFSNMQTEVSSSC